jgi:antitoxin (DNA-binding transcriptional repressor) of toxin-antitoxin stability system
MDPVPISVTEASRNFSDCVNRARYQGTSFVLLKGGSPVARIEPAEAQPKRGRELAAAFVKAVEGVHVGEEEATSWLHDLEQARGAQGRRGDFSPWRF